MYDFDTLRLRENVGAEKWSLRQTTDGCEALGVVPFSVADMEFVLAPEIKKALQWTLDNVALGYTVATESYRRAVTQWMAMRHGFAMDTDWIVPTYGVVSALYCAVRAFTAPGEGVIVQTPVYPPFCKAVVENGRRLLDCPLLEEKEGWRMDFEALERAAADPAVKLAILCSPHNPIGRVWTEAELRRYGEICQRHGVLVVSDEIHCDLVFSPHVHHVFGGLGESFLHGSILCTAPSKTFNLAGLTTSNILIANEALRQRFQKQYALDCGDHISVFGYAACEAAYRHCAPWLEALLAYVWDNFLLVKAFFAKELPAVRVNLPEGTYLQWVDFSALGLTEAKLDELLLDRALFFGVKGSAFGPAGALCRRVNVACPRTALAEGLQRVKDAFAEAGLL